MKAIIWTKYGSPNGLKLGEVEKPLPRDHEILVKIHATTVTAGDCEMRRLELPLMLSFPIRLYAGLLKPKRIPILGQELAGEIVETGQEVTTFQAGDPVYGTTGFGFGAYAEYICLPAEPGDTQGVLAKKPANLTYAEAAAVPTAGLEALHYLRAANTAPGTKVLVIGAGGSIGTFAIQLARHFGAEVTAVDSTEKLDLMHSLGANQVVDYTRENITQKGETYDIIIDVVGRHEVRRRLGLLKRGGVYFLAYASLSDLLLGRWTAITSGKRLKIESASQGVEELKYLTGLLQTGELKSVIDRTYPLDQVPEAHRYAESGQKKGNIAITVVQPAS